MPGYSLPDAAGMWDPLGILQICRLWIIYILKRNGHVQCRVFLRGEDILKFWQKLVWLWIVLGCEWFWGPDKWRGLGSGRRQLVVRQFCIHASTAGEAVTMITRCLAQHGDMLFFMQASSHLSSARWLWDVVKLIVTSRETSGLCKVFWTWWTWYTYLTWGFLHDYQVEFLRNSLGNSFGNATM